MVYWGGVHRGLEGLLRALMASNGDDACNAVEGDPRNAHGVHGLEQAIDEHLIPRGVAVILGPVLLTQNANQVELIDFARAPE